MLRLHYALGQHNNIWHLFRGANKHQNFGRPGIYTADIDHHIRIFCSLCACPPVNLHKAACLNWRHNTFTQGNYNSILSFNLGERLYGNPLGLRSWYACFIHKSSQRFCFSVLTCVLVCMTKVKKNHSAIKLVVGAWQYVFFWKRVSHELSHCIIFIT